MQGPAASSLGLATGLAVPDACSSALERVLAAEVAEVLGVLGDFHLLGTLPQVSTITSAVLADNADLLCPLGHCESMLLAGRDPHNNKHTQSSPLTDTPTPHTHTHTNTHR